MLYNYIAQVHCLIHHTRCSVRKTKDDLLAADLAVVQVFETGINALDPTVKQPRPARRDLSALDKLGGLLEELGHVGAVLWTRGKGQGAREDDLAAEGGVDERELHFDVGAQALRRFLRGEDHDKLSAAGTERLHAENFGILLGHGVEPHADAVLRDFLDLADGARVFVLWMCGLMTRKHVEVEGHTSKTASAPSDLQSSWFLGEAVVTTL